MKKFLRLIVLALLMLFITVAPAATAQSSNVFTVKITGQSGDFHKVSYEGPTTGNAWISKALKDMCPDSQSMRFGYKYGSPNLKTPSGYPLFGLSGVQVRNRTYDIVCE